MTDFSIVEDWLDRWEAWRGGSVDEFVARHLQNQPAALVEEFRRRVRRLAAVDRELASPAAGTPAPDAAAADTARDDLSPGSEPVPGYRLEARLGRGGFGEVWRAAGPGGFPVALKFVRLGQAAARAERRALDAVRGVRHPHLLSVFGAWDAGPWLVIGTELADRSLSVRLAEARAEGRPGIPPGELVRYMTDAADALDHLNGVAGPAGTRGVQHRDVKPPNLLLVGGRLKVGDFGLARVQDRTDAGHTGSMTHAYAPPEFFDRKTSARSDQYSLAVTYCELQGGRLPFIGSPVEVMRGHLEGEPDLSMVPAAERPAVRRALAKSPADRWPSCRAFVDAVAAAAATEATASHGRNQKPPTATPRARWRWPAVFALATLAAAVAAVVLTRPGGTPRSDGEQPAGDPPVAATPTGRPTSAAPQVTVRVGPFRNAGGGEAALAFALPDLLADRLARWPGVRVVNERPAARVIPDGPPPASPGQVFLLTGSYSDDWRAVDLSVDVTPDGTPGSKRTIRVSEKPEDVGRLQTRLLAELAGVLGVPPEAGSGGERTRPGVKEFDALVAYGKACEAIAEKRYNDVRGRLSDACSRDPGFGPARSTLAAFDAWGKHHWPTGEAERRAALGPDGRALEEHHNAARRVLLAGAERPAYLAAFLTVAAHAGLLGQTVAEQELLALFWQEFAERVPPDDATRVWADVRPLLDAEGRYFRARVDAEANGPLTPRAESADRLLKPNLRGTLRWPAYCSLWPFDLGRRADYHDAAGTEPPTPDFPHEALAAYLAHPEEGKSWRATRLGLAVLRYYSGCRADQPAALKASLGRLAGVQFGHLDRLSPTDRAQAVEAIAVLEGLTPAAFSAETLGAAADLRGSLGRRFDLK